MFRSIFFIALLAVRSLGYSTGPKVAADHNSATELSGSNEFAASLKSILDVAGIDAVERDIDCSSICRAEKKLCVVNCGNKKCKEKCRAEARKCRKQCGK